MPRFDSLPLRASSPHISHSKSTHRWAFDGTKGSSSYFRRIASGSPSRATNQATDPGISGRAASKRCVRKPNALSQKSCVV